MDFNWTDFFLIFFGSMIAHVIWAAIMWRFTKPKIYKSYRFRCFVCDFFVESESTRDVQLMAENHMRSHKE